MDDAKQTQVLIVGAGPAGLTLGCELARRGVACVLAEKSAGPFTGSRGKGLQPRTQEILEDVGILDQVRAHGGPYPPLQVWQDGQVVFTGRMDPLRDVTPDVPYPNIWMLPQWRTGELLTSRLAALGGGVSYQTELISLHQDESAVTAVLRDDGGDAVVQASYLVGADGGHSTVRRELGIGFAGQTREEQQMIVADVRAAGVSRDSWHVWNAAGEGLASFRLGLCPLAGTDEFQLTAPAAAVPELTAAGLQVAADAAAGPGTVRITAMTWASLYRTNIRMAERFRAGRAFLAGDAAHVHSPAGGQGLNTSIQDAYNLAWKLAAVLGGAPTELLDSYEEERLPVAARVLGISTRLHDRAVAAEPDAHLRDDPELRQLNLGYRQSVLTREFRGQPGVVRAGDRAPDAPGQDPDGKPARLFDFLHGGAVTLLSFGPAAARLSASLLAGPLTAAVRAVAVAAPPEVPMVAGRLFVDTNGHAGRAYGVAESQDVVMVIRPDGYLGLAAGCGAQTSDRLAQYLAAICVRPCGQAATAEAACLMTAAAAAGCDM
jgi:2-polyprenyl-6-methoxyphenol hydroxylase-like FAD-dependent oxidoreductase